MVRRGSTIARMNGLDLPLRAAVVRPTPGFMLAHPAHAIALGFGAGLSPVMPGTVGTALGWVSYLVVAQWFTPGQMGLCILAATLVGWWACTRTAHDMNVLDPTSIVWDEIISFWIILWLVMPAGFGAQLAAFLVFRAFDMFKPGPIGWADRLFNSFGWRGGFGILLDDFVAAFCTLVVIAAWRFW